MRNRAEVEPALADSLGEFWSDAAIPRERWPYLAFQARRYPSIADFLAPAGPWKDRTVLDVGGGVGSLSVALHGQLGGSYHLADFFAPSDALARALARRGVPRSFGCDLTGEGPVVPTSEPYDAILLVEVLEHLLVNPVALFRRLARHLKPGGVLFLTTPNISRIGNRIRMVLGRSIKEPGRYPVDGSHVYGHVVEYSRRELDHLLAFAGFTPARSRVVQQLPTPTPTSGQRRAVRALNSALASRWELGDDLLALFRFDPSRPPPPVEPSGRV